MSLKLHLGCGEVYLKGYVNIDYPPDQHTVMKTVADKIADIQTLRYKGESVDEVRLHHVFEHFPRAQAAALLASWHSWLKPGGIVHIEVPDFEATAKKALSPFTNERDRKVAMRHVFGSNEAAWAVHYDAWTKKRLEELLETFGFKVEEVSKTSYLATRNIAIIGSKASATPTREQLLKVAHKYLAGFLVDHGESEGRLLEVWIRDFEKQLNKSFSQ